MQCHEDRAEVTKRIDLLDVMLDLDPGMLVWTPQANKELVERPSHAAAPRMDPRDDAR